MSETLTGGNPAQGVPTPPTQDDPSGRKWTWEEDGCTVIRSNARSGPGCHDNCGVLMYVRDGVLEKIEGDPENPYNQGRGTRPTTSSSGR